MSRRITPSTSVANLKREAKRWLKALRAGVPDARARLVRSSAQPPREPVLRDVQHALAREFGFPGWNDLLRAIGGDRDREAALEPALQQLLPAALAGDIAAVRTTLDAHPDVVSLRGMVPGHSGLRSALHFAVSGGHVDVVRLLLERGADPNVRDAGDNALPLHFAAEQGQLEIVKLLIDHGADPIGADTVHELEVIGWATVFGKADPEVVEYLLAHGARHIVPSAVATGDVAALRRLIAEERGRLEVPMDGSNRRRHPLHLAVVKRQPGSLGTLLELGADTEALDSAGFTPLDQAAIDGQSDLVQLLLEHGARVGLPAALALGRARDIDAALRAEPRVLAPGQRLGTLIIRAAERAPADVLETLIRHGADVNVQDSESMAVDGTERYTALHAAAFHGNVAAAQVLLAHGASVTVRDSTYLGTPLGWAAYARQQAVVDLLVAAPIDIIDAVEHDQLDRIRELAAADPEVVHRPIGHLLPGKPRFPEWLQGEWTPLDLALARDKRDVIALLQQLMPADSDLSDELVARFLDNACPDHHVRSGSDHLRARCTAMRMLQQHPAIATASLATRIVCGDVEGVRSMLAADPAAINRRDGEPNASRGGAGTDGDLARRDWGKKGWTPLLYCAFTRLPLARSVDRAVEMMRLLVDAGADPNGYFMAGDSRYTPLVGVIGEGEENRPAHPHRDELVDLLLASGAEPFDQQVVYNIHFQARVLWFLERIYRRSLELGREAAWRDPSWSMLDMGGYGNGARWHLTMAINHMDAELAEWCLAHGADPNAPPARADFLPKTSLYEFAVRQGQHDIAELLVRYGAAVQEIRLTAAEQLLAAAQQLDRSRVERLIAEHPDLRTDSSALFHLVRRDRIDAVTLLLDAGVSVDVTASSNETALHQAVYAGSTGMVQLLLDRGATVDVVGRNFNNTPLGAAVWSRNQPAIDLLAAVSRDVWEMVHAGKVERVRALIAEHPDLARAAGDGHTLLMWLPPDDEALAIEIARLLLSHGADAAVRNQDGMTAAERAERMGMSELAAVLRGAERKGAAAERPTVASYEAMAQRMLGAYRTGTPEAMERHYADTWHRREWSTMRRYVLADLGIRQPGEDVFPEITLDDARRWIANESQFRSWRELVEFVSSVPPQQRQITRSPVGAASTEAEDARRYIARDWDSVIDAIESQQLASVHANGQMTDDVLARIAKLSCVTALHLGGSKQLTDAGLAAVGDMPQLRTLDISGTQVSDAGATILRQLPQLETLKLGSTRITDAGAAELAYCRKLQRVDMIWTGTGDGAIRALAGLPALRHLVSGSRVTDAGLAALHEIPAYQTWQGGEVSLHLTSPKAEPNMLTLRGTFTDHGMRGLIGLDGLFGLGIESPALTAHGLRPLIELPHLGKLSFDAHDDAMPIIARMPALRFISIQDTDATDDGWTALATSRTIEGIWGRRCHGLRDRGFRALSTMPALRNLSVSCKNVTDDAIALLPRFPALRELMPMDIPDEGYRHIGQCDGLEVLTLMYCRDTTDRATELITPLGQLRKYFASYTRITDRTPALLATMSSLEEVEFSACAGVTQAGISALAALPNLRKLKYSG